MCTVGRVRSIIVDANSISIHKFIPILDLLSGAMENGRLGHEPAPHQQNAGPGGGLDRIDDVIAEASNGGPGLSL